MIINFYNVGGGGGGGTTNYNDLENKPQINGVTLSGNVSSDQLGIVSDKLQPVSATPQTASAGTLFSVYSSQHVVKYGWDNVITPSHYSFNINEKPAVDTKIGTFYDNDVEVTIDVYTRDNNGYYIEFGSYLNVEEGQSGSTFYYEEDGAGIGVTINYTNTGSVVFDFWYIEEPGGQEWENTDTVEITYEASDGYDINELSLKQAYPDESGNTIYKSYLSKDNLTKWFNWNDDKFMIARELPSNDGDYLCHVNSNQNLAGVAISDGVITDGSSFGMSNVGDGYWVKTADNIYNFVAWIGEDGYLYWKTNVPISMLDAYDTGTDKQGGIQLF